MDYKQCNGNHNHMYEWKVSSEPERWVPCHLYNSEELTAEDGWIYIFTRNGSITQEPKANVRKMSKETYLEYRNNNIKMLADHHEEYGFHKFEEQDLLQWKMAQEVQ